MKALLFILLSLPLFATCQDESVYDEPLTTGFDEQKTVEPEQEYDKKCKRCPAVPINSGLALLAGAGIAFGVYSITNKNK